MPGSWSSSGTRWALFIGEIHLGQIGRLFAKRGGGEVLPSHDTDLYYFLIEVEILKKGKGLNPWLHHAFPPKVMFYITTSRQENR